MKFLQEAQASVFAAKQTITQRLIKSLEGYQPARSHKTVHASDITSDRFCPRQTALLDITGLKKKDQYISAALNVTFDVGNVMSDLFREKWATGWCYGNWECERCGEPRTFSLKPTGVMCPVKGHKEECLWKYREMNFVSQKYDVSGSLDAVCELGSPQLFVTELKIMTPIDFEKIVAPLPEHRIRTSLYLKLVAESNSAYKNRLNLQRGKVLYISRAYGKAHPDYGKEILPFKEFDVVRDDGALTPYLDKAVSVQKWRKEKKIPAGVCGSSADPRAKSCAVCAQCFSSKFPVSQ